MLSLDSSFQDEKVDFSFQIIYANLAEISEQYSETQPLAEKRKQGFGSHEPTTDRIETKVARKALPAFKDTPILPPKDGNGETLYDSRHSS